LCLLTGYLLLLACLPPQWRVHAAPLALVPVAAAAAMEGLRAALRAVALVLAAHAALSLLVLNPAAFVGNVVLLPIALGAAWLRSQVIQAREQARTLAALAEENLRLSHAAGETEALRRLSLLKDDLMRTLSHELRTPLSYI
jgi:signal transduction histidine kinase